MSNVGFCALTRICAFEKIMDDRRKKIATGIFLSNKWYLVIRHSLESDLLLENTIFRIKVSYLLNTTNLIISFTFIENLLSKLC